MAVITVQEATEAGVDARALGDIVNGPASGTGSVVATRTGGSVNTVQKTLALLGLTIYGTTAYNHGAVGDGVTDDTAALQAMAAAKGYIYVIEGTYRVNTTSIDVPIFFGVGARLEVPSGQVVTFRNRIEASPKQQIFGGDGTILFAHDNALGIGEDSKVAYAAWWGIFAQGQTSLIQTTAINKALSAYETIEREGQFVFDIGSYRIDGTITVPRGVWLTGNSTRRTIIDLVGSGYNAIETGGQACRISGIQFEQPAGSEAYFDGVQIALLHSGARVENCIVWNAKTGIMVDTDCNYAYIDDIRGVYGHAPGGGYPVNSATVHIRGDHATANNIRVVNTSNGPESIVLFGNGHTNGITNGVAAGIITTEASHLVKVLADTDSVSQISINGGALTQSASAVSSAVKLETSGVESIEGVAISGITCDDGADYIVDVMQSSTGRTRSVSISACAAQALSTKAARLTRTAGDLESVAIGKSVSARGAGERVEIVGDAASMADISVPDHLMPVLDIADNAVASFRPPVIGGELLVKNAGSNGGFPNIATSGALFFDVGLSPSSAKMYGGAGFDVLATGTVPTGTTGTDGNLSVSAVGDGRIYVENRTGGTIEVRFSIR